MKVFIKTIFLKKSYGQNGDSYGKQEFRKNY